MSPTATPSADLLERARVRHTDFASLLIDLVEMESPSDDPAAQRRIQDRLADELEAVGMGVRRISGRRTGGALLARPDPRPRGRPFQLVLGHSDTVWPLGSVERIGVEVAGDRLRGPGSFDAKGGLAMIVHALRLIRDLGAKPSVTPIVLIDSDEEIGSPESRRHVARLARRAERALVTEPALGLEGRIKTRRKGASQYRVVVRGRSAHGGLDPGAGASAIVELSHVVQAIHELNDPGRGVTVNVGTIEGGVRPNVVAGEAVALVDVRTERAGDRDRVEAGLRAISPATEGTEVEVEREGSRPPLEPTPRNRALWRAALGAGRALGLALEEGLAGGVSDGNTASRFTATLDGLGAVGDGAHAEHEFVDLERTVERIALLASLMLLPPIRGGKR